VCAAADCYTNRDSKGTTGQYASLHFGPAGNLSIAYYDRTRMDAMFVTRENGTWVYQTIERAGDVGKYMTLGPDGIFVAAALDALTQDLRGSFSRVKWNGNRTGRP
jgi:hypothetical protein